MKPLRRITQALIAEVVERLKTGQKVQMDLPSGGALHLDRMLPFLCVSRTGSPGLERLVRSEAAYITAPPRRFYQKGFTQLVRAIVEECVRETDGFMIIELWEGKPASGESAKTPTPSFKIVSRQSLIPADSLATMRNALSRIRVQRVHADVQMEYKASPKSAGAPILIPYVDQRRLNCFWMGLEVAPVYRDPETGVPYPHLHRIIHRGVTRAIKQTVFTFCHVQTSERPKSHLSLGPRGVPKKVWDVDRRLTEVAKHVDFLFLATPINSKHAWAEFGKKRHSGKPRFFYRPIPFDVALIKRRLYQIPIDELADPVWGNLFQQKRKELDTQLSMLRDRNTQDFFFGSMQLFGGVSETLLETAQDLLKTLPPQNKPVERGRSLSQIELKTAAEEMVQSYRAIAPDFEPNIVIRDDVAGLIVTRDTLHIGELRAVPDHRTIPLLTHEIGTHLLTYYNACKQPLGLLQCGLPGYDELQEGLAVLSEHLAGGLSASRMRLLAGRVIGVDMLTKGAPFQETYRLLVREHQFEKRTAFIMTMRIYRGGGLTKDAVYLRGLVQLLEYLQKNTDFEELLTGKFNFSHISIIRELTARKVLGRPALLPHYLSSSEGLERLQRIHNGINVNRLIGSIS